MLKHCGQLPHDSNKIFYIPIGGFSKESDWIWDLALLLCPLQDPFLDGALADEAVDGDLLGLTQSVSPVHGLLVHCGVPVTVIEDNLGGESEIKERY